MISAGVLHSGGNLKGPVLLSRCSGLRIVASIMVRSLPLSMTKINSEGATMSSLLETDQLDGDFPAAISRVENYPSVTSEEWDHTDEPRSNSTRKLTRLNPRVDRARERHSHGPPSKLSSIISETSGTSMRTRYTLLQIIHAAQPVSRVELARRLGIKRSRVSEIINPLLAAGVCRETSFEQVSGRLDELFGPLRPPVRPAIQ